MKKLNKPLLIAFVLGVAYVLYSLVYWSGASADSGTSAESAGAAIATLIVMPHLICTFVAVVFNALGLFMKKSGFALVAGILYAVAMALFFAYFFFVVIQMILSFVGYTQLKSAKETQ